MFGNILMILRNQICACEKNPGETAQKTEIWTERLKQGLLDGIMLSSIDFDSGSANVNLKNRLSMLINL